MKHYCNLSIILTTLVCTIFAYNTSGKSPGNDKYEDPYIARADIVFDSAPRLTPSVLFTRDGILVAQWSTGWGDGMPGQTAHNKSEMAKSFPDIPFYIAGNLLRIP